MGHYASEFGSDDRRTLLDLAAESPETMDAETVKRLVLALRHVQSVARAWDMTGLAVSSQIDKAIRCGLVGIPRPNKED